MFDFDFDFCEGFTCLRCLPPQSFAPWLEGLELSEDKQWKELGKSSYWWKSLLKEAGRTALTQ